MGLGVLMHMIAKIVFVLVGYGIHMFLGKTLTPAEYGSIGVVMSIININYNFLSNGARQAVSHLLADGCYDNKNIIKKGYSYQLGIAFILMVINFTGADLFAFLLNEPDMANYIRLTSILIPFTAGYFLSVGICNGFKYLVTEAVIVTLYPLLRLSIIFYVHFQVFKDSVFNTILGFLTASVVICLIGSIMIRRVYCRLPIKDRVSRIDHKSFIRLIFEFLSFFISVTILLNIDMLFVNALVLNGNEVGYYTGAANFAKVSYYLLSAIYLVALPLITSKYSSGNIGGCCDTIKKLFYIIFSFILPIVMIAGPMAGNLMSVFYKNEYRAAGGATEILMFGQFVLGLFVIINVLICSTHNKKFSVILGWIVVILDVIGCCLLIPKYSITGAAAAMLLSSLIGCVISAFELVEYFRDIWSHKLSKLILLNLVLFIIMTILGRSWNSTGFFTVLSVCALSYLIFCLGIIITKTISIKELSELFIKSKKQN